MEKMSEEMETVADEIADILKKFETIEGDHGHCWDKHGLVRQIVAAVLSPERLNVNGLGGCRLCAS